VTSPELNHFSPYPWQKDVTNGKQGPNAWILQSDAMDAHNLKKINKILQPFYFLFYSE
jgi:hypothetical protein